MAPPPLALRLWDDPSWAQRGKGLGCEVYATRAEWVAARRAWEAAHGMALPEWFGLVCADTLARDGLEAMNAVFSAYLIEGDEDEDPRLTA
jgi:hypothetical protein